MREKVKVLSSTDSDFSIWKEYYDRLSCKGVYHCPEYIRVLAKHYKAEAELFLFGDDDIFVYYPYLRRRLDKLPIAPHCDLDLSTYFDIVSSWYYGGPLFRTRSSSNDETIARDFMLAFNEYCRENQVVTEFIRFDPNLENFKAVNHFVPIKKEHETVVVDLQKTEEEIWRSFSSRTRNRLRNAKKHGFQMESTTDADAIGIFHSIYTDEMKRKTALKRYHFPLEFFIDLFRECEGRFYLLLFEYSGVYIGGVVCAAEQKRVHDFLRASLREFWNLNINNWIVKESIFWARNKGNSVYDLQGGREGVLHFKSGFSKCRGTFYTCSRIHLPKINASLVAALERSGASVEQSYFPWYRIDSSL
jgi:hypothetical protein